MNFHNYILKMELINLIFFSLIYARECEKGETQCTESMMLICTDEGYWSKTECPSGSVCKKDDDIIGCQNNEELDDDISIDTPINENPGKTEKKKSKVVTVTKKKSTSSEQYKTVTVTKSPKEIDLEMNENNLQNGKVVTYSIILQNPSQGGNSAQMVAPSISMPSQQSSPTSPGTAADGSSGPTTDSSSGPAAPTSSGPTADSSLNTTTADSPVNAPTSDTGNTPTSDTTASSPTSTDSSSVGQESVTPNPSTNNTQSDLQPSTGGSMGNQTSESTNQSTNQSTQSSGQSTQSASQSSGGQMITEQKLTKALKENNMTPNNSYIQVVVKQTNSHFKDKEMAAMFLAQLAHESGGFAHIEEIACKSGGGCAGQYGTGAPGKSYHGRGFIQLSWPDNYKNASKDLGMGDKLYQTPEVVASDVDIGMKVSIWYWDKRVVTFPGVKEKKQFGLTTKAINGELECKNNANIDKSKRRYALYKSIAKEMGITNLASESGCYTM